MKHLSISHFGVFAFALTSVCFAQCPPKYEVTAILHGPDCGILGEGPISGTGMNELAWVTGFADCAGPNQAIVSFGGSEWEWISLPAGTNLSRGLDVSDSGIVVGWLQIGGNEFGSLAFRWDGTSTEILYPLPDHNWSEAIAINSWTGWIVGFSANNVTGDPPQKAVLWDSGEVVVIGSDLPMPLSRANGVNDKGEITGWMLTTTFNDARAYIWDKGNVIELPPVPGGFSSEGRDINSLGHVVGEGRVPNGRDAFNDNAFYWDGEEAHNLGTLPGYLESGAQAINDADQIVGACDEHPEIGSAVAFLWEDGVMYNLNELVELPDGFLLKSGRDINNAGQILAGGSGPDGSSLSFVLTPTSSPADFNCDGSVSFIDLLFLLQNWGDCNRCVADLNHDGTVSFADLLILLDNWG